jgi:hypothetical protein
MFWWICWLLEDANALAGKRAFASRTFLFLSLAIFVGMMLSVFYSAAMLPTRQPAILPPVRIGFALALGLTAFLLWHIVMLYRQILLLSGRQFGVGKALSILTKSILFYWSLPYLQLKMNELIIARSEQGASTYRLMS